MTSENDADTDSETATETEIEPATEGDRETEHEGATRVAFVCVRNAGRSQMATAFAERERERRGLEDSVEILAGGTHPAEEVHGEAVDAMAELGIEIADRTPRAIATDELRSCDYAATMGCSTLDLGDAETGDDAATDAESTAGEAAAVDARDWDLEDPDGKDPERVRAIRDEVERRVVALFDEIEGANAGE